MREHIVEGVHYEKCIQTLHCYWHAGYRADIKAIARQALTTTVCDKLLNAKATRWEEHKQSVPPFVTFPWLEEEIREFRCIDCENDQNHTIIARFQHERTNLYAICYFGSLIRFTHFMTMSGRNSLPCLPWRPVTDFSLCRFLNNFLALKLLTVLKYFLFFRTFEQLVLALKNRVCPEFTVLNIYF